MVRTVLIIAAVSLAAAVIIGAFGAHSLKSKLTPEMMQVYKTGVEYHFYHALGMLLIGILSIQMPSNLANLAALLLFAGIVIFSGSLYILAITGIKWLGAITPLGGFSFIAGWICLVFAVLKHLPKSV